MGGSQESGGGGLGGWMNGLWDAFSSTIGVGLFLLLGVRSILVLVTAMVLGTATVFVVRGVEHVHDRKLTSYLFTIGAVAYDIAAAFGYLSLFSNMFFLNFTIGVLVTATISTIGILMLALNQRIEGYFKIAKFIYTSLLLGIIPLLGIMRGDEALLGIILGILLFAYVGFSPIAGTVKEGKGGVGYIAGVVAGFIIIAAITTAYIYMPNASINPRLGMDLVAVNGLLAFISFANGTRKNLLNKEERIQQITSVISTVVPRVGVMQILKPKEGSFTGGISPWFALTIVLMLEVILTTLTLILHPIPYIFFMAAGYAGGLAQYIALALAIILSRHPN